MSSYFDLDPNNLVTEWVQQPKLYHDAAVHLAHLRALYERAETDKDLIKAELSKEIRSNPSKFGLEKVTDEAVKQAVIGHAKYQSACNLAIDRMEEKDVQEAEVRTLDHKKSALESLVYLRNADYYSTPQIPKKLNDATKMNLEKLERDNAFAKKKRRTTDE